MAYENSYYPIRKVLFMYILKVKAADNRSAEVNEKVTDPKSNPELASCNLHQSKIQIVKLK